MKRERSYSLMISLLTLALTTSAWGAPAQPAVDSELRDTLALAKSGKYKPATERLFALAINPRYTAQRLQIKYLLGLTLFELKLYQTAAFQFVDVIRSGESKFLRPSLARLSVAADKLDNDTLLNYAISRIKLADFPAEHRDMLNFRLGEFKMKAGRFDEAIQSFDSVRSSSSYYGKAKYQQALAFVQKKDPEHALSVIAQMERRYEGASVTDPNRVIGLLTKARTLYQKKDWDRSIEAYREIPRDTLFWHDALFESSWAMLRAARFRSAISNFASLHSTYYEDFYNPESLLLRGIVYLYICKYEELGKTLDSYEQIYSPIHQSIINFLKINSDPLTYYSEAEKVAARLNEIKIDKSKRRNLSLPFLVTRKIIDEGDFSRNYTYVKMLISEQDRIERLGDGWRNSPIGRYAQKLLATRLLNAKRTVGRIVRNHLLTMQIELRDLTEQAEFLRYEAIGGRKTELKKKIAGKDLDDRLADQGSSRSYYIQNGFEYWPFQGEYWLDEIGNYHYLGVQSCE